MAGGFIAHAVDDRNSITTSVSISYLGTAKLEDILDIECVCPKIGRNLEFSHIAISCRNSIILLGKIIFFPQANTN